MASINLKKELEKKKGKALKGSADFCILARDIKKEIEKKINKMGNKINIITYEYNYIDYKIRFFLQEERTGHIVRISIPNVYSYMGYSQESINYNISYKDNKTKKYVIETLGWTSLEKLEECLDIAFKRYRNKPKGRVERQSLQFKQGEITLYQIVKGKAVRVKSVAYKKIQEKNQELRTWDEMLDEFNGFFKNGRRPLVHGETYYKWFIWLKDNKTFIYGKNMNVKMAQDIYDNEIKKMYRKMLQNKGTLTIEGNSSSYDDLYGVLQNNNKEILEWLQTKDQEKKTEKLLQLL